MKPQGNGESTLKTQKKGNVIVNPKKEDLMSEKSEKRWQDSDGDGKWYEPGQDVAKPKPKSAKASLNKKLQEMKEAAMIAIRAKKANKPTGHSTGCSEDVGAKVTEDVEILS